MKIKQLFRAKEQVLFPSMVIWAFDFKLVDDPFMVSFEPDETKSGITQEFLGIEVPNDHEDDELLLIVEQPSGHGFFVAKWDVFLKKAKPRIVRKVKKAVAECNALALYEKQFAA